jgi:pimeloyl-ACP methyl ester carboxylesterase
LPNPRVNFIEARTRDGLRVIGLCSSPSGPVDQVVLHVHGYGGDFYSNRFVRECHTRLPQAGISFVSFNLRYSGYLVEAYSEAEVDYVGSALVSPDKLALDIDAILEELSIPTSKLVLQGHSFGTNVVKCYANEHPEIGRVVFLSPSDSERLYEDWLRQQPPPPEASSVDNDPSRLRWDLFGIVTSGQSYPLPITGPTFESLINSLVFKAWSESAPSLDCTALVIQGKEDQISNLGATGNESAMSRLLPGATRVSIEGTGHIFSGKESEVCASLTTWIQTHP